MICDYIMLMPLNFRLSNGSFTTTLPKPLGIGMDLDKMLNDKKGVKLIAESVEDGVLIRHPTEDEIIRFKMRDTNE